MHFVVMGCGRVGARLAHDVEALGHSVAVVDQDPGAFRRLDAEFTGLRVAGVGIDRDTLRAAGIDEAYAFAAVSSGDNSNIIAARLAQETFGVRRVVARIYDPGRAAVYRRLGIVTVATVPWTSREIIGELLPTDSRPLWTDGARRIALLELEVHPGWIGRRLSALETAAGCRAAYLGRLGRPTLPEPGTVLQEGDRVFALILQRSEREAVAVAARPPESS